MSINEVSDSPINEKVLQKSFDAIWDKMYDNISEIIKQKASRGEKNTQQNKEENSILEEILQLIRKQDSIISNPEKLLPIDYLEYVNQKVINFNRKSGNVIEPLDWIASELVHIYESSELKKDSIAKCFSVIIDIAMQCKCERNFIRFLENKYDEVFDRSGRRNS